MINPKLVDKLFRVRPGRRVKLKKYHPGWAQTKEFKKLGKETIKARALEVLRENLDHLAAAQSLLYADNRYSVLAIFQAMDAAGKDGTIKHVMSGVNPQGCQVFSFKHPSAEELDHTYLWRYTKALPERGRIGIFNRSYYEEVLIVRVHPEVLEKQRLPTKPRGKALWKARYEEINDLERHLVRNGTIVLKFFLNVSKNEQKERFLERLENREKHWKFSASDIEERVYWDAYQDAYEDCLSATSTDWAPWYIVPADNKWVTRAIVADILTTTIQSLDLRYPEPTAEQRRLLAAAKAKLMREK